MVLPLPENKGQLPAAGLKGRRREQAVTAAADMELLS
jgi:hypothetical protein